ncbi:hypothetical protein PMAC_001393 [Pneumocystis sp. 'macacae']|nr:hypothetical protein PMAC_001393 [Pneumocystis sp. 'macacae']
MAACPRKQQVETLVCIRKILRQPVIVPRQNTQKPPENTRIHLDLVQGTAQQPLALLRARRLENPTVVQRPFQPSPVLRAQILVVKRQRVCRYIRLK